MSGGRRDTLSKYVFDAGPHECLLNAFIRSPANIRFKMCCKLLTLDVNTLITSTELLTTLWIEAFSGYSVRKRNS